MPNYEDYLEHFFDNTEVSIREGKGQELSDNLSHVAELIQELIDRETDSNGQFRSNYAFCRRQYIDLYNTVLEDGADEDLRTSIIDSISAIANYSRQANDLEAFDQLLNSITSCYVQSYPNPGFDDAVGNIFERYSHIQYGTTQTFEDVDSVDRLAKSQESIDTLLQYYRELWRCSIENGCKESIKRLHHNLEDVRAFERAQYLPLGTPESEYNEDFLDQKQEIANTFGKRIQVQKFAGYSWGYNLYVKGIISEEEFIEELLQKYAEQNFSSISSLTETYFEIQSILGEVPYWENWETNRQLQQSLGPVMTSMGANSWMPSFYLAFSLYLFDEDTQENFSNSTPEELPFPTGSRERIEINSLLDAIEEFEDDYPLDFLLDAQVDINERIEKLSETLDRALSHAEKQDIMRMRNHPIESEYVDSWEKEVNDQFDSSCLLKQALKEIGLLKQKPFPPDLDGIKVSVGYPRKRNFVPEEAVHKSPTGNFQSILDSYREYVFRRMTLEEHTVDTVDELLDEIEDQVERRRPSVILFRAGEHRRKLLEDDRFTHGSDFPNSHHTFLDIPVLTEATETYSALLLLENESHGVEFVEDDLVFNLEATPGEEAEVIDMPNKPLESIPYTNAPLDFVEMEVRFRGYIQSEELDGVLFQIDSEDPE